MDQQIMQVHQSRQYVIHTQEEEKRSQDILISVNDNVKKLKAFIKSIKERHKVELAKHLNDMCTLETVQDKIKQAIIARHQELERVRKELQEQELKKYDRRVERAEKNGGYPWSVTPPAVIPADPTHKVVEGKGSTTVMVRYRYSIPGHDETRELRMHESAAKRIPRQYFVLSPPVFHASDPWPTEAPDTWFVLDKALVRRTVDASKGENVIPGIIIEKYETIAVKQSAPIKDE